MPDEEGGTTPTAAVVAVVVAVVLVDDHAVGVGAVEALVLMLSSLSQAAAPPAASSRNVLVSDTLRELIRRFTSFSTFTVARSSVQRAHRSRSVARAAGHVDDLAGDEPGALADQEGYGVRHVLGAAGPADRDLADRRLLEVLEVDADPGRGGRRHVGHDEAGRDRVRGDPEPAQLDRERLGEALQAGLGRGVVGLAPVAQRRGAGQADDAAPARRPPCASAPPG